MRKRILLISIVVLEIVAGGIGLFIFHRQTKQKQALAQVQLATKINKENVIFPEIGDKYYWELKPNTKEVADLPWINYQAIYTYNSDGLSDRFDYPIDKQEKTFRIIALGDSFTFGASVGTEYSWPEQLEDLLKNANIQDIDKFEVINLGMGGFDIPYIIRRYQTIGAKYHPDLIIWFESGSGFLRFAELSKPLIDQCEKEKLIPEEAENSDKNLEIKWNCWVDSETKIKNEYTKEHINDVLINKLNDFLDTIDPNKILFFTYSESKYYDFDTQIYERSINNIKSKHPDIKYLPIVKVENWNDHLLLDQHPSRNGQAFIAKIMYQYLIDNYLKNAESLNIESIDSNKDVENTESANF